MDDNENKLIGLMAERRDLLIEALRLTETTDIDGGAESYVELMDSREKCFLRIYEIDRLADGMGYEEALRQGSDGFRREADEIYNAARATAFRIIESDKANKKPVAAISEALRNDMKIANRRKNIQDMYSDQNKLLDGQYFDKTK